MGKAFNSTNGIRVIKPFLKMFIQSINSENQTEFVAIYFKNIWRLNGYVGSLFGKKIVEGGEVCILDR